MKNMFEKIKKILVVILILSLISNIPLQGFGLGNVKAEHNPDLGNIFTQVVMTKTANPEDLLPLDKPLEITESTEVGLMFYWKIPDEKELLSGDYAQVKIPEVFKPIATASGNLIASDNSTVIGTFLFDKDTGYLKLQFNEVLQDGGDYEEERSGTVGIMLKFDLTKFEEDTTQLVQFEFMESLNFSLTVKPAGGTDLITKTETHEALNAKEVTWTVDLNTSLEDIDNAIFKDTIPAGLQLVPDSVKMYPLSVGYYGDLTPGAESPVTPVIEENGFSVPLGQIKGKAYRIVYKTKITSYAQTSYTNNAVLYNGETELDSASKTINAFVRSAMVEKFGTVSGTDAKTVHWEINVNKAESIVTGAAIQEVISDNQTIKNNTIKVYKLVKSGSSWSQGTEVTPDIKSLNTLDEDGNLQFPITLGDLKEGAYRIVYDASVIYGENYYWEDNNATVQAKNKAILTDSGVFAGESETSVNINRSELLTKTAAATVNYSVKQIKWTIVANAANHPIKGAVIHDQLPAGLTLVAGSLSVKDSKGATPAFTYNADEDGKFTISLGDITSSYSITYTTTVEKEYYGKTFHNKAWLSGVGTGVGPGTTEELSKDVSIAPTIANSYIKGTLGSKTYDSITYDGINYDAKTMSWQITVKPVKRNVTELTISDTFPKNGMVFLKDTLRLQRGTATTPLVEGTDYTIEPATGPDEVTGYQYGFVLKLKGAAWSGADYYIYYKTTFDQNTPNIIINTDKTYENQAVFSGKAEEETIDGVYTASYGLSDTAFNNGKKEGTLDRQKREIGWKIYTNYLSVDKGSNIVIEDTYDSGQHLLEDSFIVTKYKLDASGNTVKDGIALIKDTDYTLEPYENGLGFKVTITKNPQDPYVIEYKTKIDGLSKANYNNKATVIKGASSASYEAKVSYPDYNNFVEKAATDVDSNMKVYPDDEINWKVALNKSLSEVQNAIFTDVISSGHVYLNDSLKVYKITNINTGTREIVDPASGEYTLISVAGSNAGEWNLTVIFSSTITSKYEIEYKTVVTAKTGVIKNSAKLTGTGVSKTSSANNGSGFSVTQTAFGTGGGTTNKGKITINKRDKDTGALITSSNAEFELYYYLNGTKTVISGSSQQTTNGILVYQGLSYRTYYLRELTPPGGYYSNNTEYEITVNSTNKSVVKDIINEAKKGIKVVKVDLDQSSKKLVGAKFKLVKIESDSTETVIDEKATNTNGELLFNGLEYGNYKLIETAAPNGYQLPLEVESEVIEIQSETVNPLVFTIRNESKKSLKVIKEDKDTDSKKLSGAVFKLYDSGNQQIGDTYSSDSNGIVVIFGLINGIYKLVEITAPEGYQLPPDTETTIVIDAAVDQSSDGSLDNIITKVIKNESKKSLKIVKEDKENSSKKLFGAVFKLYDSANQQIGDTYSSDSNGIVSIPGLVNGTYKLVEITAPEGYQLPQNTETAIIINAAEDLSSDDSLDNIITKVIKNASLKTIKIIKVDSEEPDKTLQGAEFKLYDADNVLIGTYTTDSKGEIIISGLKVGSYRLVETKAPEGYKLPDNPVTFIEITHDTDYDTILPSIGNEVYRSIKVIKVDAEEEGIVLKNAEFELWKDGKKVADNIKTDDNGIAVIPNLLLGDYKLIEIKAPEGYITPTANETDIEIKVGSPLQITVTVENDILRTLIIRKLDRSDKTKLLEGAEFTVTAPDGTIEILKTGNDGTAVLTGLKFGEYLVKETKAPQGYILDTRTNTVRIDNTSIVFTIEVENQLYIPDIIITPGQPGTPTPTPTPIPTPTPSVTPVPTKTPTPTVNPEPTPTKEPIIELTPENTPKGGKIPVPDGGKPSITKKPDNGKATVDKDGNWSYIPDKDFTGKDDFTIVIKHPDGTEEEVLIEIDVNEVPKGGVTGDSEAEDPEGVKVPKTGEEFPMGLLPIALIGIAAGGIAFIRVKKKEDIE
ncbi:SpaA isopeptide-forming pilin-related protein [Anaerocolumna sp. AGMB13020]|uniref:SpaA isopeptide-forming pilin-related protein n=1 Tax=Anaerocolumna sp. AGMB13020 TaxID=3081750 RepID=UPI0029554EDB|nr:SpaA isopeptide-forming pilin-related protein [Anaerocolumna sp. AGMB13020]WOO34984.1 SpaA isopeptide-forming pilin-related protein [Anaerocolumna sp. AGMB13020]